MNRIITVRLSVILLCIFPMFNGCSTMPGFKRTITPNNGPSLKIRVLPTPIIVRADMTQERGQQLNTTLYQLMQKDTHFIVRRIDEASLSHVKMESLQFGATWDPVLAEKLEALKIDVVLSAVLNPIDIVTEKKGILCFKKEKSEAVFNMMMNAMDVTTGTVLSTHLEFAEIKLPTVIPEDQETRIDLENTVLDETLSSILTNLVQRTSDTLESKPWMGRLAITADGALKINGGKDIGVFKGSIFEVFKQGEPIQNFKGKEQFIFGPKVGEIKAVEVLSDHSIAEPLSGEGYVHGQIIRIKAP